VGSLGMMPSLVSDEDREGATTRSEGIYPPYKGRVFEKMTWLPWDGILWGAEKPTTPRREAMSCQASF